MFRNLLNIIIYMSIVCACATTGGQAAKDEAGLKQAQLNTSMGREYMDRGQYEIALDKLKKALQFKPDHAPAHTVLAVLYEQLNEPQLAERHYIGAVEAAPANGDVNNNYGVFLCKSGKAGTAERHFIKATQDPFYRTPAVALANAGSCFLQAGDLDKAEKYLRQSLEYDAEFADALLAMANLNQVRGEHFGARAFLQRYEGAAPVTPESLTLGWRIETGLNNERNARAYLEKLLAQFPGSRQAKELSGLPKQ